MPAALHALFTATLKQQAKSEHRARRLNQGGAVTTAESACHSARFFIFFYVFALVVPGSAAA